jgi:hypothetical protein
MILLTVFRGHSNFSSVDLTSDVVELGNQDSDRKKKTTIELDITHSLKFTIHFYSERPPWP